MDGYLLGLHRLGWRRGEEDIRVNAGQGSLSKKVVYLHHGLMMNSEAWVCLTERERCLPFMLVEKGYDVWVGLRCSLCSGRDGFQIGGSDSCRIAQLFDATYKSFCKLLGVHIEAIELYSLYAKELWILPSFVKLPKAFFSSKLPLILTLRLVGRICTNRTQLGNNRGNKYSKKSTRLSPLSTAFWNYSLDQFAFHDIPDSINYILETTSQPSLSYVGFSQGTAQAFATLSIHPTLNDKVDVFIALAPAMSPPGLHNGIVNALTKASPEVIFLAFGRKSMLSSATMWQALLYPPLFVRVIDMSLSFLFNWSSQNIGAHQKLAAYPHLYSFTSTKSVVHWFQIIRNKSFQMYDDDVQAPLSIGASDRYYKVAKFPTRNIKTPIVLVYGGSDSLVDISVMLRELPRHTVAKEIPHFEHLDFLWAQEVDTLVFPHVFEALDDYAGTDHSKMRPVTYKSLHKGGTLALAGPPSYSEDERSLLTTDASEVEYLGRTTAARNYAPSPREPSSPRYMRSTQNVNNRSYVSLSSASDLASVPGDGAVESPSPARARHLRSASLRSNTKNKRSGSLSNRTSWDGTASANQFRDNSTASGVSMTIAGVGDGKGDEGSGSDGGKK